MIALTHYKITEAGEKPDLTFARAARAMGLDDDEAIATIRKRAFWRWKGIKRLNSKCIFAEADRIANLK